MAATKTGQCKIHTTRYVVRHVLLVTIVGTWVRCRKLPDHFAPVATLEIENLIAAGGVARAGLMRITGVERLIHHRAVGRFSLTCIIAVEIVRGPGPHGNEWSLMAIAPRRISGFCQGYLLQGSVTPPSITPERNLRLFFSTQCCG
ncbi:MAG: hypothetical protein M2R45_04960 [Verrucomicrobia subdivision 3 bacterium]|nr:hypothetical protein [Limisphaerales bacterium]MCS1414093.1 hypothetical protein [Limisphaerales bacterium]